MNTSLGRPKFFSAAGYLSIMLSGLLIAGCSGDGGGVLDDGEDPGSQGGNGNGLNPGLPGALMLDGKLVDLASGSTSVPVGLGRGGDRLVTPLPDRSEYVELVDECEFDFQSARDISCIVLWDENGVKTAEFLTRRDTLDRLPEVSPDASTFVIFEENAQRNMVILDRSPAIINSTRDDVSDASWAPDGSLYYVSEDRVLRIPPGSLADPSADQVVSTIEPGIDGFVSALAVSPDGRQIAITRVTQSGAAGTDGTVWLMDIDGSNLRRFARGPNTADGRSDLADNLREPVWSPDGRWILVTLRPPNVGTSPTRPLFAKGLFALSAEASDQVVLPDGDGDRQIRIKTVCFEEAVNADVAIELALDLAVRNGNEADAVRAELAAVCQSEEPQNAPTRHPVTWVP